MRCFRIVWSEVFFIIGCTLLLFTYAKASDNPQLHSKCNLGSSQFTSQVASIRNGIQATRQRPKLPFWIEDPDGLFRIHYSVSGPDAVPTADGNLSGIPDYVEECLSAMLYSRRMFIDSFQYSQPASDAIEGGSAALDVYLLDLSKLGQGGVGLYGETVPENLISAGPPERFTTWIQIDNDFAESDLNALNKPVFSTHGIDALRITCSHEFHHAIQIGAYGIANTQLMIYELTSTYFELRLWPTIHDWHVYVKELLLRPSNWPMSNPQSSTGYVWGWFGSVLCANNNQSVLRKVWENIGSNQRPFEALVNACSTMLGKPLSEIFCESIPTLYKTGARGANNPHLPNADLLPEVVLSVDAQAQPPSVLATGELRPFEVRYLRYSVPSFNQSLPKSAVVALSWPNVGAFVSSAYDERLGYTVIATTSPMASDVVIGGTEWGVRVAPNDVCYSIEGSQTTQPEQAFPHPVVLSQHVTTNFPVRGELPGNMVEFELLNTQLVGIENGMLQVMLNDDRIVAQYNVPESLLPGTYVVRIRSASSNSLFKILVKR